MSKKKRSNVDILVLGHGFHWAPYVTCPPESTGHWFKVEDEPVLQYGKVHVPHYEITNKLAPPSIEVIVEYGKLVISKLIKFGEVVHYGDCGRSNMGFIRDGTGFGAILAGYYLLLHGAQPRTVFSMLRHFVRIQFPSVWCDAVSKKSCRVGDCLLGLGFAIQHKWLQASTFDTASALDIVQKFDSAWIVPEKLMVLADPMSTLMDPTMNGAITLHPKSAITVQLKSAINPSSQLQKITVPSKLLQRRQSKDAETPILLHIIIPPNSLSSNSKASVSPLSPLRSKKKVNDTKNPYVTHASNTPFDFATFFHQSRIELLVRCNFRCEEGLNIGGGSYASTEFDKICTLLDIPFPDFDGGLPTEALVRQFLNAERNVKGVVAIHCKSGFGRSVTLAAVYLMYRYNFSGAAALGWIRLCRRGAITTPLQEEYIQRISKLRLYGATCCTIC